MDNNHRIKISSKSRFRRLTNVEVVTVMLAVLIVWVGYLTADIQYNRQLSLVNQQNLIDITNSTNENSKFLAESQNRTKTILPPFLQSIKDTHRVAEFMPRLVEVVNNTARATQFLADNFGADSHYLDRENFQYHQANSSFAVTNNTMSKLLDNQHDIKILLNMLNRSLTHG